MADQGSPATVTVPETLLAAARKVIERATWEEPGHCKVPAWIVDALETEIQVFDGKSEEERKRKETDT